MVRDIMPGIKTLGLPFNPSEQNARYAADMMQKECDKNGIKLVTMPVYTTNDVMDACHSLLQKNIDAFALAADNTLFLAQDAVVKIAAQSKRPLMVYDATQVERGAAAGTGVDYREWGREAGLLAARVINGISPSAIGTVALVHQQLYLNNKAAAEQGVTFPDELVKRATRVMN
jgi:putative ABC transport system substrate-binding protein